MQTITRLGYPMPAAAEQQLREGRIVEAIRIVQAAQNVRFREAKQLIETFIAGDPLLRRIWEARRDRARQRLRPWFRWTGAAVGAISAYILLRQFH